MTDNSPDVPPTVLSALQAKATSIPDDIAAASLHPCSASSEQTVALLQALLDTTEQLAHSITQHSNTVVNDSRTVSLLRQQSAGQHTLHLSRTQVARTMAAAEERRRADTGPGYDGPSDDSSVLARISALSSAAGMQAYPPEADTMMLGGQVVVLDVGLVPEPTVRTSYAGSGEDRHSPAMDAFFSRLVRGVVKGAGNNDGRRLREALGYLMRLDRLATQEGNAAARWFGEVDALSKELVKFTQEEAALLAQIRGQPSVPLDVLLLHGHALALPYLHFPALCFLVYLSPRAYLSIQRSAPMDTAQQLPSIDIPSSYLYSCLNTDPSPPGVTRAALTLVPLEQTPSPPADPLLSSRPSFPLAPTALGFTHNFPLPTTGTDAGKCGWVLSFGKGIIMSQTRMLEIARVVQPHDQLSYSGAGPNLSFMTGGWADMLLNPEGAFISERYTATYVSPTSMHPPLRLTLTTPDEPGFVLERVQVHNMQEVWAVLEIVRDQCWLNDTLSEIAWVPEAIAGLPVTDGPDGEATEEELRALLSGTYTPRSIPVNVYVLPAGLGLTFPERPPMPGMVIISVSLNGAAGATVEVQGAMGADVQMSTLGEAVRRGGTLGLPGRVWAASQAAP